MSKQASFPHGYFLNPSPDKAPALPMLTELCSLPSKYLYWLRFEWVSPFTGVKAWKVTAGFAHHFITCT